MRNNKLTLYIFIALILGVIEYLKMIQKAYFFKPEPGDSPLDRGAGIRLLNISVKPATTLIPGAPSREASIPGNYKMSVLYNYHHNVQGCYAALREQKSNNTSIAAMPIVQDFSIPLLLTYAASSKRQCLLYLKFTQSLTN